ncbi:unnamed protein product [Urochloa humidicola]
MPVEEQSGAGAAARGVGEGRRVSGVAEEEEEYERSADLAAAGVFLDAGPSAAPAPAPISVRDMPVEDQSGAGAAARGVGEGRRVSGVAEEYERSAYLAAAGVFLDAGPSAAPAPIAALFYPSPPPTRLAAGDGVVMGRNTAGGIASNWNYNISGEVAHLKRFELHLEKWEQGLKDREDALDRREREVEDAAGSLELRQRVLDAAAELLNRVEQRAAAALSRREQMAEEAEALSRRREQMVEEAEALSRRREQMVEEAEALSHRERAVEEAEMQLEQQLQALKVQEDTLGTTTEGPLLLQLERKKNDETCNWGLGFVTVNLVLNVLVYLHRIRTLLPHGYFTGIVHALALLWALSSIFLSNKVSGRYRSRRKLSYYVAWLISLCFSLAVLYVLYVMSAIDGT